MKVVELNINPSKEEALSAIDGLRRDIEAGKIIGFAVAAMGPEDTVYWYCGSVRPVTRLRLIGALSNVLHHLNAGDV